MQPKRGPAPGPFRADQIRSKDPYELSNGHAIFAPPTGVRGGRANLVGGEVLDTDPMVDSAGTDVGISDRPSELRAPDLAIGNLSNEPGWAKSAPPLAVEYADVGQDEDQLHLKIGELLAKGTRFVWVVRLAGERCVEVYEAGHSVRVVRPGEMLTAPGILANPVLVESLYDRDAAHAATLRNLLHRRGFRDLEHVQKQARDEGGLAAIRETLSAVLAARQLVATPDQQARIEQETDREQLTRWVIKAATVVAVADLFD